MLQDEELDRYRRIALKLWVVLGGVALAAVAFFLVYQIRGVLPPFIYALILVYLLRPPVNFLVSRNVPRLAAVIVTYLAVVLVLVIAGVFLIPIAAKQIAALIRNFPDYLETASDFFAAAKGRFARVELPGLIEGVLDNLSAQASAFGNRVLRGVPGGIFGIFGGLIDVILAPILAFYLLKDLPAIQENFSNLLPQRWRDELFIVLREIDVVVGGYLRGQVLVSLVVGVTISIYLWAIGVNFPVLLGMLSGVLNIIPYFGPIAGGAVAALVALFQSPNLALAVIIGMFVIQQIDSAVVSPNIMRHAVDLHPVAIVFALIVGGALFGFLGLLLAIPVAGVAKGLLLHYLHRHKQAVAATSEVYEKL